MCWKRKGGLSALTKQNFKGGKFCVFVNGTLFKIISKYFWRKIGWNVFVLSKILIILERWNRWMFAPKMNNNLYEVNCPGGQLVWADLNKQSGLSLTIRMIKWCDLKKPPLFNYKSCLVKPNEPLFHHCCITKYEYINVQKAKSRGLLKWNVSSQTFSFSDISYLGVFGMLLRN